MFKISHRISLFHVELHWSVLVRLMIPCDAKYFAIFVCRIERPRRDQLWKKRKLSRHIRYVWGQSPDTIFDTNVFKISWEFVISDICMIIFHRFSLQKKSLGIWRTIHTCIKFYMTNDFLLLSRIFLKESWSLFKDPSYGYLHVIQFA